MNFVLVGQEIFLVKTFEEIEKDEDLERSIQEIRGRKTCLRKIEF